MALTHFLFQLIFQATVRCLTCTEIAGDPKVVARYRQFFNQAERLSPAVVLFPWFPSPSMVMRSWATKQMYDIIVRAMKVRKESGIPQNDTLQMLLDSGEEHFTIVGVSIFRIIHADVYHQFMMGFVLAGARATGTAGE
jgi:sterol 14-demethylase